jgi:hypothetical protein
MDKWPVPYKELTIFTSFGETRVITNGAEIAPPVVLLHALLATATSWHHNVGTLSQTYRVYALGENEVIYNLRFAWHRN